MYRRGRAIKLVYASALWRSTPFDFYSLSRLGYNLRKSALPCSRTPRYNIYNKRILNVLPMPWLMASAQLGIGLLYVFPLWLTKLRKAPKLAKGSLGPLRYAYYDNDADQLSVNLA